MPVGCDPVVGAKDGGDGANGPVGGVPRVRDGESADQASLADRASRQLDDRPTGGCLDQEAGRNSRGAHFAARALVSEDVPFVRVPSTMQSASLSEVGTSPNQFLRTRNIRRNDLDGRVLGRNSLLPYKAMRARFSAGT